MTSANVPPLERLLEAARAEVAAQKARDDAEEAYRRAWWTTTLLLGAVEIPRRGIAPVMSPVAELLGCTTETVAQRRRLALRVDPAVVADESIYGVASSMLRHFVAATGVETIGPREVVVLQEIEAEGWTRREVEHGGAELRDRLGLPPAPPPPPQRATPRSKPTVRFSRAQLAAISDRARLRNADGGSLARLADGALDVELSHGSAVDRFRLTAEGVVIEGPP